MKKLILISPLVIVSLMAGCAPKDKASTTQDDSSDIASQVGVIDSNMASIKYETEDKKEFILTSKDKFTTAILLDAEGNTHVLKEALAGSGMLLKSEGGVSIHTHGDNAIIELSSDRSYQVKEVK